MADADKIILLNECLNKLLNDIWAKADGFYGGNPNNDWITTQEEQDRIYPVVMELADAIQNKIDSLSAAQ